MSARDPPNANPCQRSEGGGVASLEQVYVMVFCSLDTVMAFPNAWERPPADGEDGDDEEREAAADADTGAAGAADGGDDAGSAAGGGGGGGELEGWRM